MTKYYTAYGLIFQSDIDLPELLPFSGNVSADITIREVDALSEPISSVTEDDEICWESSAIRFAQHIPDVADFLVTKGQHVEFVRVKGSADREIRVYLLGAVIAALLQQRGLLTLHASTIKTDAGAVLFMGRSGAGKSTLLNALLQRGYTMMCDDVTAVRLDSKMQPITIAGFPRSRLWADSAVKLAHKTKTLERVSTGIEKYTIPVAKQFFNGESPIQHIFILTSHNQDQILLEPQSSSQNFSWLQQYTYRKRLVRGNALMQHQFKIITSLCQQTTLTQISRPEHLFLLDELVERVVDTITP